MNSIDATEKENFGPRMGRLVNHSKNALAKTEVIIVDKVPHLCLFCKADMFRGQQVLFDYGLRDLPFHDEVSHFLGT